MIHMREYNAFEAKNVKFLVNKQIEYATIQITQTGYNKGILDTTVPVRAYFLEKGVHDFELQPKGQEHKKMVKSFILTEAEIKETQSSLYRPETKDGDPRMWVYKLKDYVNPDDIFAIIIYKGSFYVINLTQIDIEKAYKSALINPIQDLINSLYGIATTVSEELLGLIRDRMSDWLPSEVMADTGIGRTVESVLGIEMNDSKKPDYKGIELKSKRINSNTTGALFTNIPDWNLSKCKSGREIADRYGYLRPGLERNTLQVTVSSLKPNAQGLGLNVNWKDEWLEMNHYAIQPTDSGNFLKLNDVSVWTLLHLHERLAEKHHETFWIDVESRIKGSVEEFRVTTIEHTKNPLLPQFDVLLEQGKIKLDLMLSRPSGRGDTYSFKMDKKWRPLLFPESETYIINKVS